MSGFQACSCSVSSALQATSTLIGPILWRRGPQIGEPGRTGRVGAGDDTRSDGGTRPSMTLQPSQRSDQLAYSRQGASCDESWATTPAIRRTMQGCRGRDTSSELALRSAVHRLGLRYSVDVRPVEGLRRKADLVFRRQRLAVFLDGCFWHGCPLHYSAPAAHAEFWNTKLRMNRQRDSETDRLLLTAGWTVLRIWEHEDLPAAAVRVRDLVLDLRTGRQCAVTASRD